MKVGHAVGLSCRELGSSKWQLRWRQMEDLPEGGRKRIDRTVLAYSIEERKRLEIEIEVALREKGYWIAPLSDVLGRPLDLDLERVAERWVGWKVGLRGIRLATRGAIAGAMKRWFTGLRVVLKIKPKAGIPSFAMTGANIALVAEWMRLKDKYAPGTIYQTLAAVIDMWTWAGDQPEWSDLIPRPPYNKSTVMPTPPCYEAPEAVATMAEADACLRQIRFPMPRRMATIMRYTGLRIEQAASIHREDIDIVGATVLIRKGKSQREQALMRRVPVSRHLIEDLRAWLVTVPPTGPLFPDLRAKLPDGTALPMVGYRNNTKYVSEAWAAATEGGEARREVWAPLTRKKHRPDHAFRAAFQAVLQENGIGDNVIEWLVGHAPSTTRGKHYTRPAATALEKAVASMPPVDWRETNVTVLRFDKRARA